MIDLKAGPEFDALVAERVMGIVPCDDWEPINLGSGGGPAVMKRCAHENGACYSTVVYGGGGCPRYSTEIRYAWEVVEWMRKRGLGVKINICGHDCGGKEFSAAIEDESDGREWRAAADSMPLAICRAALGHTASYE